MPRKPPLGKSLAELNPDLAKEWHPIMNDSLTPNDLTLGSNKKVWWKCKKGDDHEWISSINNRSNGRECPVCSGRKTVLSNCLATLDPNLAREWHPIKNGSLSPFDVTISSGKKVWWKCDKGDDHEWKTSISHRSNGRGCPICAGKKVVLSNCLATLNPELAKEWHPTKNGDLTPLDVSTGTDKKVWWKCKEGDDHEWQYAVSSRSNGSGCQVCSGRKIVISNSLATLNPKLAKEWHPTKNGDLTPYDVSENSHKKVWWKCDKGDDHEWQYAVSSRSNGSGCQVCSGRKIVMSNSLATLNPKLAKEWHPTKNGDLTPYDVSENSHKKVWWKCDKGDDHEWMSVVSNRTRGNGCSVCSGRTVVKSNCLATLSPAAAKEWHPTKNGLLTPFDVTLRSNKKIWWKCDKGDDHEWQTSPNTRSRGDSCPICTSQKIVKSNSLGTLNPKLTKEWHPTKNKDLTPYDVGEYSNKKVWWKCDKGDDHEWKAQISSRSSGIGCSVCNGSTVVKSNSLATLNPTLAREWHPIKNGSLSPFDVTISSGKKVWWKCDKGDNHEWKTSISHRSNERGCPICNGEAVVKSNCLATLNPDLAKEWHPTKNGNLTPYDVREYSNKKIWWKCDKGDDHEWITSIANRSNDRECPVCSGRKIVLSNCLATLNPKLTKEWHPTKNKDLTPYDVTEYSNKKVWWKCDKGDDHEWKSAIYSRSNERGCPYCTLTPQSKQELTITFELIRFFEINPKGFKTRVQGKTWTIDIYIPELKLGIEFDGSYWHKDKRDLDKLKTEKLVDDGFTIMRVRQEPLKAITDIDVISKNPFNAKKVTNDILEHIMMIYPIDAKKTRKIEKYLLKESIQNEKGLDAYIEMILTEKAEKNGKNA